MTYAEMHMTNRTQTIIKWFCVVVMLGSVMWAMRALPTKELTESLQAWIETLGIWGPVVFGLIYVVATVCFVPGLILTIAAGAIFGLLTGFITVSISSVIGAACAFMISRYLARSKIEAIARSNSKFGAIDEAIREGGWKIVGLLRLSPAIPYNLHNYLYGLPQVQFCPYGLVSWIAMAPGTILYVYLGHVAGLAASGEDASTARWALLGVGLLATIVVTFYITRLAKKKLDETEVKDTEQPAETQSDKTSPTKTFVFAAVAILLLIAAGCVHWKSDAIASWMKRVGGGPPDVEMEEVQVEKSTSREVFR